MGARARLLGRLQGPRPPAAGRGAAGREGTRRSAEASGSQAGRGLRSAIRGAARRRPGGEEPGRRSQGRVQARAGEVRQEERRIPGERTHAPGSAGRIGMRSIALVLASLLGGCSWLSSPAGPKPAELPRLEKPREVRVLWSARVGSAGSFAFAPALVGDAVYAAAHDGRVARLDAASGTERWSVSTERKLSGG